MAMPGCEKMDEFADIELSDCCKTYPKFDSIEALKQCTDCKDKEHRGEKMCCLIECVLKHKNLLNESNFLDMELFKAKIIEITNNNDDWTNVINEVSEDCIKQGKKVD